MDEPPIIYLIDTNIIVDLSGYPDFEKIWAEVIVRIELGQLKVVRQFWGEIKRFKNLHKMMVLYKSKMKVDQYQEEITDRMGQIEKTAPSLIDYTAPPPDPADPWLIAVALEGGQTVVTSEKRKGAGCTTRIPYVCKELGVRCINTAEFLEETGIRW